MRTRAMFSKLWKALKNWPTREKTKGQGLVEYCFVIAFVSILIALAFGLNQDTLFAGISHAYSTCNSSLNALNNTALNPGGAM